MPIASGQDILASDITEIVPIGAVFPFAGYTAPTGYLICDGTAVSRTTYSGLLAVLCPTATFTVTIASPGVVSKVAHGLVVGDRVQLTTTGALPTGLTTNTYYYVISAGLTADAFQVSLVRNGTAVNTSGSQSGTHTYRKVNWGKGDGSTTFSLPDFRSSYPMGSGQRTRTTTFDGAADVDPATDLITVETNDWLNTGQSVVLSGSSLPTGLSATTYYVIRISATTIKLATTIAEAHAGTAVNITADGSGTCTFTQTLTSHFVGESGGEEAHSLTSDETGPHFHNNVWGTGTSGGGTGKLAGGNTAPDGNTNPTALAGLGTPHSNNPIYNSLNYIIRFVVYT